MIWFWHGGSISYLLFIIYYIVGVRCVCRSFKATVIDAGLQLHASATVHFDSELPHYGTRDGVHRDSHGKEEEHNSISFLNYLQYVVIIRFSFHVLHHLPIKFTQQNCVALANLWCMISKNWIENWICSYLLKCMVVDSLTEDIMDNIMQSVLS